MRLGNIGLKWLGHSSFLIKTEAGKTIYIDPYNVRSVEKADIILITHPHYDHCSVADINRVAKDGTIIVVPAACQSKITKLDKKIQLEIIEVGQTISLDSVKVGAVPAYNTNKPQHPKSEGWLGYVIKIKNLIIYHAGDTDLIPEMKKLTGYGKAGNEFLALLPVGGTFTMNAEQASEAAASIQPTLAIPMHWGSVVGNANDAEEFVKLCREKGIKAEILNKEWKIMELKVKISSKYWENLERLKGLVKLAVGSSSFKDFVHVYSDNDRKIVVEPLGNKARVSVFYKEGVVEKEIYSISYSKLNF